MNRIENTRGGLEQFEKAPLSLAISEVVGTTPQQVDTVLNMSYEEQQEKAINSSMQAAENLQKISEIVRGQEVRTALYAMAALGKAANDEVYAEAA